MTADEFHRWMTEMKAIRGRFSQRDAARELGVSENSIRAWKRKGAPLMAGLACAALACNLSRYPRVWSPKI